MSEIQIGENTHHQLHAITLVNFKTRKTRNKRVGKPILPEFVELFAIYLYLFNFSKVNFVFRVFWFRIQSFRNVSIDFVNKYFSKIIV